MTEVLSLLNFIAITWSMEVLRVFGLLRWSVSGKENLPPRPQGIVLVVNHIQWHDIPFIGWALPLSHRPWWLAKVEIVNSVFGWWFHMMHVIPVRRGQRDIQAIDRAADAARSGKVVIIFPEGTRSHDGKLLQGRGGTARIALRAGVPIVPMAITGTQKSVWFSKRHITIGEPYYPEVRGTDGNLDKIPAPEMARLTNEIMLKIAALLPSEYYGYYTDMMQDEVTRQNNQASSV
jgi:1-acyl-sn-glycerol-3-phosphate acyltransferase